MSEEVNGNNGSISEWNEGNFKNLRLHEAQEMINMGKVDPFSYCSEGTSWNYQIWKAGIDILFGEGSSKYKDTEIKEVEKICSFYDQFLVAKPPFKQITEHHIDSQGTKFIPNQENQKKIKKILQMYEKIVKQYNDDHGLSTRNKEEEEVGWD